MGKVLLENRLQEVEGIVLRSGDGDGCRVSCSVDQRRDGSFIFVGLGTEYPGPRWGDDERRLSYLEEVMLPT